jgi:hypothetical protein
MQVWISPGLNPKEVQGTHEGLGNDLRLSFPLRPSQQPILHIIATIEFALLPRANAPFLTFSALASLQMKAMHIDPHTFRPPHGANRLKNLFLLGNTLCPCLIADEIHERLQQFGTERAGVLQSTTDANFLVTAEPLEVGSQVLIVWPLGLKRCGRATPLSPHLFRPRSNRSASISELRRR